MARRRTKKRTHVGAMKDATYAHRIASTGEKIPKSMVLRMGAGEVGPSVSQLVKDVREMMEPNTASRLKERRSNKLKDYTTMAGPLGVSHLLLFSRSAGGHTNLRIALAPRGPTFFFQVEKYSLCKDVKKAMKHPKGGGNECLTPPLLVMNNFVAKSSPDDATQPSVPKHLESLTTSMFQSLFPSISPQDLSLSSIRRVLLLNRERATSAEEGKGNSYVINLRHYAISTRPTGLSRGVRRLHNAEKPGHSREQRKRAVPNLGKLDDVADYFLDPTAAMGYTSGSESEAGTDAEVEVVETQVKRIASLKKAPREGSTGENGVLKGEAANVEKRAVKLDELGPRMRLRLIKVEEGLCSGKVMWHDYLNKSKEEEREMDDIWEERRKQKDERRKQQQENVERKRKDRPGQSHIAAGAEDEAGEEFDDEDDEMITSENDGGVDVDANGGGEDDDEKEEEADGEGWKAEGNEADAPDMGVDQDR